MKRLAHQTAAVQKHAVEQVFDYAVGQHVRTVDGPGVVVEIQAGRVGDETYVVRLDNGLGGGDYNARQVIGLVDERTAAVTAAIPVEASFPVEAVTDHTAAVDYPELSEILIERPPAERVQVTASKTAIGPNFWSFQPGDKVLADGYPGYVLRLVNPGPQQALGALQTYEVVLYSGLGSGLFTQAQLQHTASQHEANRERPDIPVPIEPPDACSFCGHTTFVGPEDTGRGVRVTCTACNGNMRSWGGQWEPEFPGSPTNHPQPTPDYRTKTNTDVGTIYGPPRAVGVQPHRTGSKEFPGFSRYSDNLDRVHDAYDQDFARLGDGSMYHADCAKHAYGDTEGISFHELRSKLPHGSTCDHCTDYITEPRLHTANECELGEDCEHFDPREHASAYGNEVSQHHVLEDMRGRGIDPDHKPEVPHLPEDHPLNNHWGEDDDLHAEQHDQVSWERTYHQRKADEEALGGHINEMFAGHPGVEMLRGNEGHPGFHSSLQITAAWRDVQAKAKRIRKEGGVRILAADSNGVTGEVRGDTATYESQLYWLPGTRKTAYWGCGCKWGGYAWGRSPAYARFEGRPCSHVLALRFEAQARGMFGREVTLDRDRLEGQHPHSPVTVQYQRPTERSDGGDLNRRSVPPGNMRSEWTPSSRVRRKSSSLEVEAEHRHETPEHARQKRHRRYHTDDARKHAPNFGYGIGWGAGPLIWCDQCNGGGCGHCGGQGQVIAPGGTATGGQGPGDMSTTTTATGEGSADGGEDSLSVSAAWQVLHKDLSAEQARPVHVRDAGFQGFVSEPGGFHTDEDAPDHLDAHLHHFIQEHGSDTDVWRAHSDQPVNVDLTQGVWATQSHVGQHHIDRYLADPDDESWENQQFRKAWNEEPHDEFLAHEHPMFVTHNGMLHAMEGHHRTAAALQRGDTSIQGWHYDLDKHPVVRGYPGDYFDVDEDGDCVDCVDHHHGEYGQHTASRHTAATSPFSEGNQFAQRLDSSEADEPYIVPRKDEYSRDHVAPGGQTYRLIHGVGFGGDTQITAHQRLSNGKYKGVGYLSWFGGKNDPDSTSNINGGRIYKVHVAAQHQRRGLATAMLNFGLEKRPDLRHSDALSEDGRAWAAATPTPYEQGMQKQADWSVGDMLGSPGPQWQLYRAPTQHIESDNPASTGWATSEDPPGWEKTVLSPGLGNTLASLEDAMTTPQQQWRAAVAAMHHLATEPIVPTHAGVALKAADTGRLLMIQRSNADESDPARGTWEFPGGGIEEGDKSSFHAAVREFEEEVGHPFPDGGHLSHVWRSGPYVGHVVTVPSEDCLDFSQGRATVNPDDPDGDDHEQSAWWDPEHAKKNPALREECKGSPWGEIKKAASWNYTPNDPDSAPSDGPIIHPAHTVPPRRLVPGDTILWDDGSTHEVNATSYKLLHVSRPDGRFPQVLHRAPIEGDFSNVITHQGARYVDPMALPGHCNLCGEPHPSVGDGPEPEICANCYHAKQMAIGGWGANTTGKNPDWKIDPSNRRSIPLYHGPSSEDRLTFEEYIPGHEYWHTMSSLDNPFLFDSTLHDEPEGALPSTDGAAEDEQAEGDEEGFVPPADGVVRPPQAAAAPHQPLPQQSLPWSAMGAPPPGDPSIAATMPAEQLAAEASLRKMAAKDFSFQEQQEIINEGAGRGILARNFASLDIAGTHYALLGDTPDEQEWWL